MNKTCVALAVAGALCWPAANAFALGGDCSIFGDAAVRIAQLRNAGAPKSKAVAYAESAGNADVTQFEKAIVNDIYSKPPNTMAPGQWQKMLVYVCHQQAGY